MSEYLIQEETLTGIADAIRGKTGGTASIPVSDMAGQIEGIETGGGDIDAMIARTITEISSNATRVGDYAFYGFSALTSANFPVATSIGKCSFQYCSGLTSANFPVATSIDNYAFQSCSRLTSANFPVATSIGNYAFQSCSRLTSANFPVATSIWAYNFDNCSALTSANFPVATSIGNYAFRSCSALTSIDFPVATSIGNYAFHSCSALTSVLLRNTEGVCTLSNVNAFTSSGIQSGTGYVYVPSALIEDYKAATNWSTYAAQFRALEDYTVDGTTTGELDPEKI